MMEKVETRFARKEIRALAAFTGTYLHSHFIESSLWAEEITSATFHPSTYR